MSAHDEPHSLVEAALLVLNTADPWEKARLTYIIIDKWKAQQLEPLPADGLSVPERPQRADDKVKLVDPGSMPRLGKGGTLASRQAIVHSLCHIENWAVDLSWDIIARFGQDPEYAPYLPREFFDDFVQVAEDECRHFTLLSQRLQEMGSHYGALPAHDGLWESAQRTAGSLPARLAVEHCTHEARGLDVLPSTVAKFRNNGDPDTADLLEHTIYQEEISHCAAGVRWLQHLYGVAWRERQDGHASLDAAARLVATCEAGTGGCPGSCSSAELPAQADGSCSSTASANGANSSAQEACSAASAASADGGQEKPAEAADAAAASIPGWMQDAWQYGSVQEWFHSLIRRHFKGNLKPPFNEAAREQAGFTPDWYLPLVVDAPSDKP